MLHHFRNHAPWFMAVAAGLAIAPRPARAADMPVAPILDSGEEERVSFGTGWYLRGDAAIANDVKLNVGAITLPSSSSFFNSWSAGLGFGYKYNEWLRTDVTADYRAPRSYSGNTVQGIACQDGAAPVYNVAGTVVGSTPVYGRCYDFLQARLQDVSVLFNGYVDVGTWYGVTPYVGAGVGFNYIYQKASRNWFFGNSNPYNPTWTDPYTMGTYSAYWDQSRSTSSLQFAWAAMAGASYALTQHASVDLGYRFLGLGNTSTFGAFTGVTTKYLHAQELRIGLRYTPD